MKGEDMDKIEYDALIVIAPSDFSRVGVHHRRMAELIPARKVYFVGDQTVGELLEDEKKKGVFDGIEDKVGYIYEDDILRRTEVSCVWEGLKDQYEVEGNKRSKSVGWYYQQFIKYSYAYFCEDDFYLVWDGDTVPCKSFSMFDSEGKPYFDYKREFNEEYFVTIKSILGLQKRIQPSFISEHMLFKCEHVKKLIEEITNNVALRGTVWWEKILYSIRREKLFENSFSEFETYGTYIASKIPEMYNLREWHSLRYAALFFEVDKVSERDWNWLSRDFFAISFEKNMHVREDTKGLFDNPRYQEKLSARQVLEIAQKEFEKDALFEVWDY